MKRILLAALLAMTVSPALAAESRVWLHCSGWEKYPELSRTSAFKNVSISKDGAELWKLKRSKDVDVGHQQWWYEHELGRYLFTPARMTLQFFGKDGSIFDGQEAGYECFPITNPFTQGTE